MSRRDSETLSVVRGTELGTAIKLHSFRVICTAGPDQGQEWTLEQSHAVVGSADDVDIRLTDPTVSRRHARVEHTPRGWLVVDQESRNGVSLDGVPVQSGFLRQRSRIQLGDTELSFVPREQNLLAAPSGVERFGTVLGRSPAMQRIFGVLEKVAPMLVTIVLTGPTGAGKGALARAVHEAGPRKNKPFVVLDCGNLDAALVRAELFGHAKGAFTGADDARPGVFEVAKGGTLFIDEIGELPLELQPRLLRVLDERRVSRMGSHEVLPVDVRVVAATHRNLRQMVQEGKFREDLLYRLAVVEVELPPLAQRVEDLPLLVEHFLETLGEHKRCPVERGVLERLAAHAWPGNVRELRNALERAVAMAGPDPLTAEHVAGTPVAAAPAAPAAATAGEDTLAAAEKEALLRVLAKHGGNRTHTAHELGIAATTLRRKMRKYGLE